MLGCLQDQKTLGTPIEELNYDVFDAVSNHLQPFLSTAAESSEQPGVSAQTKGDPAATLLPLVHQEPGADGKPKTTILEQPLDFTTLADKYNDYVTVSSRTTHSHFSALNFSPTFCAVFRSWVWLTSGVWWCVQGFIDAHHGSPFFLYMPFSHVHTTAGNMPQKQCKA